MKEFIYPKVWIELIPNNLSINTMRLYLRTTVRIKRRGKWYQIECVSNSVGHRNPVDIVNRTNMFHEEVYKAMILMKISSAIDPNGFKLFVPDKDQISEEDRLRMYESKIVS